MMVFIPLLILFFVFVSLIAVASRLLLAFCVYYDAKYHRNENTILWGVLSGLFDIAAIVYLIISRLDKQQGMRCARCGEFIAPGGICCPRCGLMLNIPAPEQLEIYDRKRKLFLGLWIGSIALAFIAAIIFTVLFFTGIISQAGLHR